MSDPFRIIVERNWDDNRNYEDYINTHYIPKALKRYYRKPKPFHMNITRNVEICFEPFFQVQTRYQPQHEYKVSRQNPTQAQITEIKFLWSLNVYPYNTVEAEVIHSL